MARVGRRRPHPRLRGHQVVLGAASAPAARDRGHHAASAADARERAAGAARRQPLMVRQLAHEIKNPLGGLRGAAQLLERELLDPALREYTRVIISEADRLTNLLDSMLGPARPPAKQLVNVHELLERVYHLLRSEAPEGVVDRARLRPEPAAAHARSESHHPSHAESRPKRHPGAVERRMCACAASGAAHARARATSASARARHRLVASIQFEDNGPGVPARHSRHDFLSAGLGPRRRHRTRARHRAGPGQPPRRPDRVRQRAGPNHLRHFSAHGHPYEREAAASLVGRRRCLHPLGAREGAEGQRHGRQELRSGRQRARRRCARMRPTC